jgi:long-chain acyl-CoA synthetase
MKKDFKTLQELILFQAQKYNNQKALNFKKDGVWRSFSNQEFLENALYFAYGLIAIGFEKGQKVAIYSYQNPIWLIVDFGIILAGGISVPIFHNISKENLLFQLEEGEVKYVFADFEEEFSKKNHFDKLKCLENEMPKNVEKIISYGFEDEKSMSYEDLIALGRDEFNMKFGDFICDDALFTNLDLPICAKNDLATIIYTSGSTGRPKGVCLSHENLVSQIHDTADFFPLNSSDKALSFLPLAHVFERMVMMYYISCGIEVYFVCDVSKLSKYLSEVKPTLMTVVPRVLEKVFAKIKEGSQNGGFFKRILADMAFKKALRGEGNCFFDSLVYKKYRQALGGKMRMVICGGAALSQDLERFFNEVGVQIYCGYGLTETSPVLSANCPKNYRFGTVGKAFNSVELKISDDGELLARGKNIMIGYYKNLQKTDEVIVDGWFKTGDLAEIDNSGFVKITGRKKELLKTANAKYVRPIPIEQKLMQEIGFLLGALVIAEGKNFVSALLFPDFEILEKFKEKLDFKASNQEFLTSAKLNEFLQEKVDFVNSNLDRSEQIFKFAIIEEEISIENGAITPSMKLKRNILEDRFSDVISGFYQ